MGMGGELERLDEVLAQKNVEDMLVASGVTPLLINLVCVLAKPRVVRRGEQRPV